jgi:hypothetical protein
MKHMKEFIAEPNRIIEENENGFNAPNISTVQIQTKLQKIQCLHQWNNYATEMLSN